MHRTLSDNLRCGLLAVGLSLGLLAGCHSGMPLEKSPLVYSALSSEVLEIVPLGTERDSALQKLKSAGIEYSSGSNESIYYCDIWNREDGHRWLISIALLFDEQGQLYEVRPADAEVGPGAGDAAK